MGHGLSVNDSDSGRKFNFILGGSDEEAGDRSRGSGNQCNV